MATIANLTWTPVPGSYGTKIEYKEATDSVWITPSSPDNPTLLNTYPIPIDDNVAYNVRITNIGSATCAERSVIKNIIFQPDACCPDGYELAPDGTYCFYVDEINATVPIGGENTIAKNNIAYSTCGSYIFDPGYALGGTGAATQISLTNPFWKNGGGCIDNNTTDGPLNRSGLWATTATSSQDVGFSVCVDILTSKTYYIGVGCDNYAIIKVDGVTIIQQDEAAMNVQFSAGGACFKVWAIYPVDLSAGPHIIELIGHNISSAAALGAEIYDNTAAEIAAALAYSDLNLIFSTKDYIGQPVQIGSGGIGYSCSDPSYQLASCSGIPVKCRKTITTPTISC